MTINEQELQRYIRQYRQKQQQEKYTALSLVALLGLTLTVSVIATRSYYSDLQLNWQYSPGLMDWSTQGF
jgi:hypothetical protein